MKSLYITDLKKNLIITNETFVIYESSREEDKNGKPYYNIQLGDKTGKVAAKIWSDAITACDVKSIKVGKVVQVCAKVEEYRSKIQLKITSLAGVDESQLEEFLEKSEYDADEMLVQLFEEIEKIKNTDIKLLLITFFNDEDIKRRFKFWPAAESVHHDFRSGLLQHVLEMVEISKGMKKYYPELNYDILLAGIVLHDIGKIYELDATGVSTSYTKIGSLLGHIVIGVQLVEKFGKSILDEDTFLHICHLILSHHGTKEYGSPVLPATLEAIMLCYIDNLSAKSRTAVKGIKGILDGQEFGSYNNFLNGVRLWKGSIAETLLKDIEQELNPESDDSDQLSIIDL
jgi:3'-5' exoribonuclease